jgi:2-methylfumaryl-CoA hydratase
MIAKRIEIDGPYFEDFTKGQVFDDAPSVTLTSGFAALHQAFFAERLRLPLDAGLCRSVTGHDALASPSLVCNVAIGQTTYPSQRVKGNLFYRGVVLQRPSYIGDTLRTETKVVALKQNRIKPGREATGLVVLEMTVTNQRDETVLRFWRCPMIPCRDPQATTGHADSFDAIPAELDMKAVQAAVPAQWNLRRYREATPGAHFSDVPEAATHVLHARDTVTCAPELVRMTLNMAYTHSDPAASTYGKRLVYGGHTISMAGAHLSRALPNLVTLVAWRHCNHTAPVFEGDVLRTEATVVAKHPLPSGGGLVDLAVSVFAERGPDAPVQERDVQVLDWHVIGVMA